MISKNRDMVFIEESVLLIYYMEQFNYCHLVRQRNLKFFVEELLKLKVLK